MQPGARRVFTYLRLALATLVVVGVFVQVYLIAAYFFGAADARSAHESVGFTVHGFEVLIFLVAIGASWGAWGELGLSFALALIGTIQITLAGSDLDASGWVHGLHGLLALVVMTLATVIAHRDVRALRASPRPAV